MKSLMDEQFGKWVRWGIGRGMVSSRSSYPSTPVENWQRCFAKDRRVQAGEAGAGRGAVGSHVRYIQHKDSHEHEDRLVSTIGDLGMFREWDDIEPHYRVIIAPERGDVLDMVSLAHDVCREAMKRFGEFDYAGAVHEKLQSNGRVNKHIHLLFKDTIGVGANAIKSEFSALGARLATLQFERKGLYYVRDSLKHLRKMDIRYFERELKIGG